MCRYLVTVFVRQLYCSHTTVTVFTVCNCINFVYKLVFMVYLLACSHKNSHDCPRPNCPPGPWPSTVEFLIVDKFSGCRAKLLTKYH